MDKKALNHYSIERKHKVTGAIFYLSPGCVRWVTPMCHQRFGTRYGHWPWGDAVQEYDRIKKDNDHPEYDYQLVEYKNIQ